MRRSKEGLRVRLRLLIPVVFIGCLLSFAGTATANNGAEVHHFSVTYPGNLATCSGNRLEKPGVNGFVKDVETCVTVIDAGLGNGTYSAVDLGWCSDYDAAIFDESACNPAISGHVAIGDNGDGTFTWNIVAYYARP
jgi:hypothetical protein